MKLRKLGILGGGQLGQMLAHAAFPLGVRCRIFEPSLNPPTEGIAQIIQGEYDDLSRLEAMLDGLDALTYEFENVPSSILEALAQRIPLFPSQKALHISQDRLYEKEFFQGLGFKTSPFAAIDTLEDLKKASQKFGFPCILKTRRLGYDGKGQVVIQNQDGLTKAFETLGGKNLILEGFIFFQRELSLIAVRDRKGNSRYYDLTENQHREGILRTSLAPAPRITKSLQEKAQNIGARAMEALNYTGVLAIELFEVHGELVINEMAPRVHNSGHWTIEGAKTSQFENHVRAVLGLPLGDTKAHGFSVMKNLIGSEPSFEKILEIPGAHLHTYGKSPKPGRKLGHVTIVSESLEAAEKALINLERVLT